MINQRKQANRESFNDGVVTICKTDKRTITSDIANIRYGLRTVGVTRFYQAKIADIEIDMLISIPHNKLLDGKVIAIINNIQYEIKQIQDKYDTVPPSKYLTLKKAVPAYEDLRGDKSVSKS